MLNLFELNSSLDDDRLEGQFVRGRHLHVFKVFQRHFSFGAENRGVLKQFRNELFLLVLLEKPIADGNSLFELRFLFVG